MITSVGMTTEMAGELYRHLARADGQEDLCFATWYPSQGTSRRGTLLYAPVMPEDRDRTVHGNAAFLPPFFTRALSVALKSGAGLAFLHSHPARGWQGMSKDDIAAESGMAPAVGAATGFPLLGLTLAALDGTWSARVWDRSGPREYKPTFAESVRVVGTEFKLDFCDRLRRPPSRRASQLRTVDAWGEVTQSTMARLRIGVVGLGSVGMLVAEALARMGVQDLVLIDFDGIDEVNLDRTLHAYPEDVEARMSKVEIAARALARSATSSNFSAHCCESSICEEDGYRRALDCDVLFSCVDRPWARSVLNFIAYSHLIPVIDGGILATRRPAGGLRGAEWKAHTVTHGHRCLLCLGQFNPALVAAEQEGHLDDPKYIQTLPDEHPINARQNVFSFSLGAASLEVLQLVTLIARPSGIPWPWQQLYHLATGHIDISAAGCHADCPYPELAGRGDRAGHPGTAVHVAAEAARVGRRVRNQRPSSRC